MPSDFIFELGCEELPSASVRPLAEAFANNLLSALDKAKLSYGEVKSFATPRRIALQILDLQTEQKSQAIVRKGPAVVAAYDDEGKPTQALKGFARSCGVEVDQLKTLTSDKGEWVVYEGQSEGGKTKDLLPDMVKNALAALPIAKPMRWGVGEQEFVRPVHWVVMLFGDEVIRKELLGVVSGNQTFGHRFHHPQAMTVASAKTYEAQLQDAFVLADFAKRKQMIKEQIETLAADKQAVAVMPEDLLEEVASIVEWPVSLIANFETEYLQVPAECLVASMQAHQKCFALKDKQGALLAHFITVSNIVSNNASQVVTGNEKVMRARLSDAAFFFHQDKKHALSEQITATEKVVFQKKLGTLQDKALRIKAMMGHLSPVLSIDLPQAQRAAELCKCDLMTGMVGEFPELQGLMGYYYALNDGEDTAVAKALNEQYMPRFAADNLPESKLGIALSLADRLDTLVGIFAIGQKPTGEKDPFKLRRHALAVVRMLANNLDPLHVSTLLEEALANYGDVLSADKSLIAELKLFILERLQSYYQGQGFAFELVQAVRARQDECFYDFDKRIQALRSFVTMPEAASLAAACKRVNNILSKSGVTNTPGDIQEDLLEKGAEYSLYQQLSTLQQTVAPLYAAAEYTTLLQELARLRDPVDAYFDKVMVMVDDAALKNNRLALLAHLQNLLQGVTDISLL